MLGPYKSCGCDVFVMQDSTGKWFYEVMDANQFVCCREYNFGTFEEAKRIGLAATQRTFAEMRDITNGKTTTRKLCGWEPVVAEPKAVEETETTEGEKP
jgi:hypothetical protein